MVMFLMGGGLMEGFVSIVHSFIRWKQIILEVFDGLSFWTAIQMMEAKSFGDSNTI